MSETSISLVLDCRDPKSLAAFWAGALDYVDVGSVENYTLLVPREPGGPHLLLQRVPEDKSAKNRMHLDVHTSDIEAEARRLEALGAIRAADRAVSEPGTRGSR